MKDGTLVEKDGRTIPTYTSEIPVDNFISMQIVETAGDPDQLRTSERRTELPMHWTYQFQAIDFWVLC